VHLAIGKEDLLALLVTGESSKIHDVSDTAEFTGRPTGESSPSTSTSAKEAAANTQKDKALLAQALKHGSKAWRRSKLSFVGEGRAGKSTLANSVVGRPFEETASTVGINQLTCDVRQVKTTAGGASEGSEQDGISKPGGGVQQWGECAGAERELENALAQIVAAQRNQQAAASSSLEPATISGSDQSKSASIVPYMQAQQTHGAPHIDAAPPTINTPPTSAEANPPQSTELGDHLNEDLIMKTLATIKDVDTGLMISLFDFGGQSVFDVIHHLFLTRNGVYALVFNMEWLVTDGPEKVKALRFMRNWLSSIVVHTFDTATGRAAPIAFVGTRLDTVSSAAAHESISTQLYENFSDNLAWRSVLENANGRDSNGKAFQWFFPVDNTAGRHGTTLTNLMSVIHDAIDNAAYTHKEVPLTWFRVMDCMKDTSKDCLSLAEVRAIAAQCSVTAPEVPFLLSFLHDMGHLMWHDEPELRDVVILDPVSFLVAPATIIICKLTPDHDDSTHHFVAMHRECDRMHKREWLMLKQEGVLSAVLLPILWKDYLPHTNTLLLLMVKFGLLVPLRTSSDVAKGGITQYLVPTLLSPAPLADLAVANWTDCGTVRSSHIVFTLIEDLHNSSTLSATDLKSSGFLPGGMFERLVGKALSWAQTTTKHACLSLHSVLLYKDVAVLSFGQQRFRLVNCSDIHCVRVDIEGSNPIGVLNKLLDFVNKIIDECMKCLRCFAAVSYSTDGASFASTNMLKKNIATSELLIPLTQLRQAARGESMLAWRGGRTLMSVSEIKSRYGSWLQMYDLREHYDAFISYRWGPHDSEFTDALFDMLTNFSVGENNRAVEVFLDRKRLQEGRRFKADFAAALTHTLVALPVVSHAALSRFMEHRGDIVDNVLLEWIMILESFAAKRLLKVFPILFGKRTQSTPLITSANTTDSTEVLTDAILRGSAVTGDFFAEPVKDKLPHVVPTATLAQASQLLAENGIQPSAGFASYTVHSIVDEMLQFLSCNACEVKPAALVETFAEKVVGLLTDCGADALARVLVPAASHVQKENARTTTVPSITHPTGVTASSPVTVASPLSTAAVTGNRPLKSLSSAELCQLLLHMQLDPVSHLFSERKVSGLMLSYCDEVADLLTPDYGLTSKGLAKGLFGLICEWKSDGVPAF